MKRLIKNILLVFFLLIWFNMGYANQSKALPQYTLEVDIMPAQQMMHVDLNIQIDSGYLQHGNLHLMHNRAAEHTLIEAKPRAEVKVNQLDEARKSIALHFSDLNKEEVSVSMAYKLKIPKDHQVNRITETWIELNIDSFWFPVINSFPLFNYNMTLDIDSAYTVMTGDIKGSQNDLVIIKNRLPRIDISFSAAKEFFTEEGDYVKVYATTSNLPLDSVRIISDQALSFLKEYLDEPEDFDHKRKVIISPRKEVGYSRKNYVVLSDIKNKSELELSGFLAHEFAHYWFSEALLSSKHHWLTESFAEYISMIFVREQYGQQAFEDDIERKQQRIEGDKKTLAEYDSRPSYLAMYYKGPLILHQFEQYLGKQNFQTLINDFVDQSIATNEGLFGLIEKQFGNDAVNKLKELRATI